MNEVSHSTLVHAAALATFALVCALLVGLVQQLSAPRIAEQQHLVRVAQLHALLGETNHDNIPAETTFAMARHLGQISSGTGYTASLGGTPQAIVIPVVAPDGYSGAIEMLMGVDLRNLSVLGVRVTSHRETPGLGDKIELVKSDWILSFNGTSLTSLPPSGWALRRDGGVFDQFTGASKTPRAVVGAVLETLQKIAAVPEGLTDRLARQPTDSKAGDSVE